MGKFMALTTHYLPPILLEGCDKGREPNDIFKWFFQKPFCWECRHPASPSCNIPVLGYFLLKGRYPACQHPMELKVPILEIGIALLFGISALFYPIDFRLLFILTTSCLLICCFVTDFEYGILPDQLTLTLVWVGLIGSLYPVFLSPQEAILGAVGGYGIFWGFNALYRMLRKYDGMFPGDFKLNAGIGACIGFKMLIPVLIISMAALIAITVVKVVFFSKSTNTGHLYSDILYKEVPYACYTSVVAIMAMYLLLH